MTYNYLALLPLPLVLGPRSLVSYSRDQDLRQRNQSTITHCDAKCKMEVVVIVVVVQTN